MSKSTLVVLACLLALVSCSILPRRETVAYPGTGGPGPAPASIFVDTVDVDRRVLSREIARDSAALLAVLAPGHGLTVVTGAAAADGAALLRLSIVERETIRDFSPLYSIMVSLEIRTARDSTRPLLTVVQTCESADSISSPWTLKRILDECLEKAARSFTGSRAP
jgi:hypothetical protein